MKIGLARVGLALALLAAVQSIIDEERLFNEGADFIDQYKPRGVCLKRKLKGKSEGEEAQVESALEEAEKSKEAKNPEAKKSELPIATSDDESSSSSDEEEEGHESTDGSIPHKCNSDLLRAFGLNVRGHVHPLNHTEFSEDICPWNRMTCCSDEDIKNLQKFFHKGLKKFYQEMYMAEQLLLLFNAKQEIISFEKLKKKHSCHVFLDDVENGKREKYYSKGPNDTLHNFFDEKVRHFEIYKGTMLRHDVRDYFYGIRHLYGSITCAICSSQDNQFFNLYTTGSHVVMNHMTVDRITELLDFEVRMAKFLHYWVRPFANIVRCANEQLDDVNFSIEAVDIERVEKIEKLVYFCSMDTHTFLPYCQDLMKVNFYGRKGLFNSPNIIKQSLKVLFKQFYGLDIENFYQDYFKASFNLDEEVYTNFYDKHNNERKKFHMSEIKVFLEERGLDLVENDAAPEFFEMEDGVGRLAMWGLSAIVFWMVNGI